jgi:hypothetical protein
MRLANGFGGRQAALMQALTLRPTRTALAWSASARLTPYADVERELETFQQPDSALTCTRPCARGALGDACQTFWRASGLKPLSASMPEPATPGGTLQSRRLLLHDVLHVLLDFKPDWPGQLGVFCFVAAQRYCPQFEWDARRIAQIYITAAPWLREELRQAEAFARQLALCTPRLLTMPIESEWNTPIVVLRDRLNIRKARQLRAIEAHAPISAPLLKVAPR